MVALAACIITLSFWGDTVLYPAHDQAYFTSGIQLWLSVVYALCPCRMRRERLLAYKIMQIQYIA